VVAALCAPGTYPHATLRLFLVLNCARSSGTYTFYKMGPHLILLFLEFVSFMLLRMAGVWTETEERRSELLSHVCSNLWLLCWMGYLNAINRSTGNDEPYLWDKIRTHC